MKPDHRTAKAFCETLVGYVLPDVRNLADCYIEVERELARINPLYTAACIQARDAEAALETAAEDAFASWDAARKAEERLATIEADTIEKVLAALQDDAVLGYGEYDQGLMCGVEDRGFQTDGYSAMRYGYDRALERVDEAIRALKTALQALRSTMEKAETPSTTPVVAALGLATQSYPGGPVYQVGASTGTYDEDTIKARDWDKWCHWCRTATHSDVECVASRKSTYADGLKQWEEKQEENK